MIVAAMEVDGIVSRYRPGVVGVGCVRSIFSLMNDHEDGCCWVCEGESSQKEQFMWRKGDPILRFTPAGLEVT